MITPGELIFVGIVSGLGGAITYTVYNFAENFRPTGGSSSMKTDAERQAMHEKTYGKSSKLPSAGQGAGQVVNNLLPMPPQSGPPLPKGLALKWPWSK